MSTRHDNPWQIIVMILRDAFIPAPFNKRTERSPVVAGAGIMMTTSRDRAVGEADDERRLVRVIHVPRARGQHPFRATIPRTRTSNVQTVGMESEPAIDVERSAGRPPILIRRRWCWD